MKGRCSQRDETFIHAFDCQKGTQPIQKDRRTLRNYGSRIVNALLAEKFRV